MLRRLAPLALCAALLAGCGDDNDAGSDRDAGELLQSAFENPVEKGKLDVNTRFSVKGGALPGPIEVAVEGPFESRGETRLPDLDLDMSFSGAGQKLQAGVVSKDGNAWVSYGGQAYEVGKELVGEFEKSLREAGGKSSGLDIDASQWIEDPEISGKREIGGEEVTRITGELDVEKMLEDLEDAGDKMPSETQSLELSEEDKDTIMDAVKESSIEIAVAESDDTVRGVVMDFRFEVPEDKRSALGGVEGGSIKIDVELTEVGEDQDFEVPEDAKPIGELLSRFGIGADSFRQ